MCQAVDALPRVQKDVDNAIAAKTRADACMNLANEALLSLRQRQVACMAARLAADLVEEMPCPVCGSADHPSPARPSEDAVSDEEITEAETVVASASKAAEKAAVGVAKAQSARQAQVEKAGDAAIDPEAARTAARQSAEALKAAQAMVKAIGSLEQAIRQRDQKLKALDEAIQKATTHIAVQTRAAHDAENGPKPWKRSSSRSLGRVSIRRMFQTPCRLKRHSKRWPEAARTMPAPHPGWSRHQPALVRNWRARRLQMPWPSRRLCKTKLFVRNGRSGSRCLISR